MPTSVPDLTSPLLLALGSNQRHQRFGAPAEVLQAAVAALTAAGIKVIDASHVWMTPPVGPPQPVYANACVLALAPPGIAGPLALLALLKSVERRFGRKARRRWGPRVLDIDIIGWGDLVWPRHGPGRGLRIPHPRAHVRGFVLHPLAQIAGAWRHPARQRSVRQLAAGVSRRGLKRGAQLTGS